MDKVIDNSVSDAGDERDKGDEKDKGDVLQFIPRDDDGKRFHILATIEIMRKIVESDSHLNHLFQKLADKVCHTAPEILDLRWNDIYRFCLRHFGDIDEERGWSREILKIYNTRIKQYNVVFNGGG